LRETRQKKYIPLGPRAQRIRVFVHPEIESTGVFGGLSGSCHHSIGRAIYFTSVTRSGTLQLVHFDNPTDVDDRYKTPVAIGQ